MRFLFSLLLFSSSAHAERVIQDGSAAQEYLDKIAGRAVSSQIEGMDRLCPTYRFFNNNRTIREMIWDKIVALAKLPPSDVLKSLSEAANMSLRGVTSLASARDVAGVVRFCRSLPVPPDRTVTAPVIYVAHRGYSTNRVYKIPERGDYAMWPVGLQPASANANVMK